MLKSLGKKTVKLTFNSMKIMKKSYKLFAYAVMAGLAFVSCKKTEVELDSHLQDTYTYTFTLNDNATRSVIGLEDGKKVINWEEGDQIGVYAVTETGTSSNRYAAIDLTKVPNEFSISSKVALVKDDWVYTYAPYRRMNNSGYKNPKTAELEIPTTQTQDGTSFKANAMPMAGTPYQMKEALGANTDKPVGDIKMINLGAIIDFKIYTEDADLSSELVRSVTFNSDAAIAGTFEYDLTAVDYNNVTTLAINDYTETSVSTTVTNPLALGASKTAAYDVYMVVAPGSYTGEIVVETDKAKYTFPITTAKTFKRNVILNQGVKLRKDVREEIIPESNYEWNLVTSADQIVVGAEVVIAASDDNYAMSQTQNANNRAAAAIAKQGTQITWEEASLVQVFEVVAGSKEGTFAFKCTDGEQNGNFIYAASSSSNYLRSQANINDNASWTISIDESSVATMTANGTNTRNVLRFNPNNGSPMFSCYASTSTAGSLVELYIKGEAADPNAKAIISNGTIEVSATGASADYEGAYTLKNINEAEETVNLTASENIVDPVALDGIVSFSMAPNYTTSKKTGEIVLTLASDKNVTATIPVEQNASSLKVSATEVVIPANATEITFTVTSPEFGWTIVADDDTNIAFDDSGEASSTANTVTVMSDVEAGDDIQTIATLTVSRTENDPQAKRVVIKKAEVSTSTAKYVKVSTIEEGQYLMVYNGKAASGTGKALSVSPVTIVNGEIASDSTVDSYAIEIVSVANNQYTLKLSNNYIGYKSGTDLQTSTTATADNYKWTISFNEDGEAYIVNVGTTTRYIAGNYEGDSFTQFKAYATSNLGKYPCPTLYKYVGE